MIRHVVGYRSRSAGAPEVPAPKATSGGHLDAAACFKYCEAVARAHHENFPVASRFLPAHLRPHVCALYAFIRTADDFADEPQFAGRRGKELDRFEDQLVRCFHGEAAHPIFVALRETAATHELPIGPLKDLLSAFRMDLRVRRYATWNDLAAYLALAARPIAQLLLYVFGIRDAERHRYAEELAMSLALTALWQDIPRDLARDRIYLPQEDLRHFGLGDDDLFGKRQSSALGHLVRFECARARACYQRARPLVDLVDDELGVEIALFWHGGLRALEKVEAQAGAVFGPRARLSAADKAWVLAKALAKRGGGLFAR